MFKRFWELLRGLFYRPSGDFLPNTIERAQMNYKHTPLEGE